MKRRVLMIVAGTVLLAAVAVYFGWWRNSDRAKLMRVYDEELDQLRREAGEEIVTVVARDRERMWRTVPAPGDPPSNDEVSPVSAINAASRVFNAVRLEGMTLEEVNATLGARPRPLFKYDFSFFPIEHGVAVYRFDCGNFGWQFNLRLDDQKRVASVEQKWIR